MTLLERVSYVNLNARETYLMHCFGKAHLLKPVRIPIDCTVLFLSDFRDFSDFEYNFRRIPKLYYL